MDGTDCETATSLNKLQISKYFTTNNAKESLHTHPTVMESLKNYIHSESTNGHSSINSPEASAVLQVASATDKTSPFVQLISQFMFTLTELYHT
jgi:hypothetical protein